MISKFRRILESGNPVRFVLSRVLWALKVSAVLTIERPGYKLRFYPTSFSASLWLNPEHATQDEIFLRRYLRPGDIVIDAGANIGVLALTAWTLVGSSGRVYAVEAHPKTFRYLVGNLRLNNATNVVPINVALGDAEGTISFTDIRADDQNHIDTSGAGLTVRQARLDDVVGATESYALLKIDVEGYEKFVLAGGGSVLRRVDCVYIEVWDEHFRKFDYDCQDVLFTLSKAGFALYRLSHDWRLIPIDVDFTAAACQNVLAIRDLAGFVTRSGMVLATDE